MPLFPSTPWLRWLIPSLTILFLAAPLQAGKLSKIKSEVESSKSDEDDDSKSETSHHYAESSQGDGYSAGDVESFFQFVRILFSPIIEPYAAVEDDWWRGEPGLLAYPYQDGYFGYGAEAPALTSKGTAIRMSADAGKAPWGHRYGGELRLTFRNRVEFSLRGQGLYEPDASGVVEELYLVEPGIGYVFALGQLSQFRIGAEGVIMADPIGPDALGVGIIYGVDCFPVRPIALSLDTGIGRLGEAVYVKAKGSLGLMLGPIEPQFGYELRLIGSTYVGTASAGVRIWF